MKSEDDKTLVDTEIDKACSTDTVCGTAGWASPPTDHELKMAYANSAIGYTRASSTLTYEEHFKILDQARQEFMRDRDFHDEERRSQALHAAISYMQEGKSPETVVKAAEAFHAFLKGEVLF